MPKFQWMGQKDKRTEYIKKDQVEKHQRDQIITHHRYQNIPHYTAHHSSRENWGHHQHMITHHMIQERTGGIQQGAMEIKKRYRNEQKQQ